MVEIEEPKDVVIKPYNGTRGEGMVIVPATALPQDRPIPNYSLVAEPFVPSKPIYTGKDGQVQDGCMRYILFVEEDKTKKITLHHFGGVLAVMPPPSFR